MVVVLMIMVKYFGTIVILEMQRKIENSGVIIQFVIKIIQYRNKLMMVFFVINCQTIIHRAWTMNQQF